MSPEGGAPAPAGPDDPSGPGPAPNADAVPDGVVLVDKPAGRSSHHVVGAVRRAFGGRTARRVGHAGTLDPFATGLLLVLVGRATKAQRYLMGLDKRYEVVARLGATSTTGDPEGEVRETGRVPPDPPDLPTGLVRQRPPAHSAVHVDGERAYRRARRGEEVVTPEREVRVDRFEQAWRDGDRAAFSIACSTGTYVRSLVSDLGDAYCLELRRTAIGPFAVEGAGAPEDPPDAWRVVPLAEALALVLPVVELDADEADHVGHGRRFVVDADRFPPAGEPALLRLGDEAVAVGTRAADGTVRTVVGFRS